MAHDPADHWRTQIINPLGRARALGYSQPDIVISA
jgi:hypothetical protein